LEKRYKTYLNLFAIAGVIIVLDQITKAWVRATIPLGGTWTYLTWLAPYARIIYITNTGVAFGLLQNLGWVFAVLAVIISGVIIYYYPKVETKDILLRIALPMQLAGALGNLIDRLLFHGKVTDFISVGNFAVWNVADASITVGVGLMVLDIIIQEIRDHRKKSEQDTEGKKS
jgi:signal peptidase II